MALQGSPLDFRLSERPHSPRTPSLRHSMVWITRSHSSPCASLPMQTPRCASGHGVNDGEEPQSAGRPAITQPRLLAHRPGARAAVAPRQDGGGVSVAWWPGGYRRVSAAIREDCAVAGPGAAAGRGAAVLDVSDFSLPAGRGGGSRWCRRTC